MGGQEKGIGVGWVVRLVHNVCLEGMAGARFCLPK